MRVLRIIVVRACSICIEHATDLLRDILSTLQYFTVPKSKNSETARSKLARSRIVISFARVSVLFAVEFDNQPRLDAAEINDERIDRKLPAEFPAVELSILENPPETFLGFSRVATKFAGTSKWSLRDQARRPQVGHRRTISLLAGDVNLR